VKKILTTTLGRITAATVLAGGIIAGSIAVASAASDCVNLSYPLCPRSVAKTQVVDGSLDGVEIKDGSLKAQEIDPTDRAAFLKDTPDVKGASRLVAAYNATATDPQTFNVGGTWATRATKIGTFTLPAGTYVLSTSVGFRRLEAPAAGTVTRPQLALRLDSNGADVGTVMGNDISPVVEGDLTGMDSRRISLFEDTKINVFAFGYQDNRGSDDSGKIQVLRALISVTQG
jgi:hypothetical protein